jgi:hypothetical protein
MEEEGAFQVQEVYIAPTSLNTSFCPSPVVRFYAWDLEMLLVCDKHNQICLTSMPAAPT